MTTNQRRELVKKLRLVGKLKPGEQWPNELGQDIGNWGVVISELCQQAADEIEFLDMQD